MLNNILIVSILNWFFMPGIYGVRNWSNENSLIYLIDAHFIVSEYPEINTLFISST